MPGRAAADKFWNEEPFAVRFAHNARRGKSSCSASGTAERRDSARKANFNPNQPRVPANNPGGGQWTRPGGVQVTTSDDFLTGISTIDNTSQILSDTLVGVMEMMEFVPDSTPQLYGMAVHSLFAASVRLKGLPGIAFWDVERTFSLEDIDPRYGRYDGIVFDPEAGRSYSPQEAIKVVSDNERALPAVEAAVRAAIEKMTRKA